MKFINVLTLFLLTQASLIAVDTVVTVNVGGERIAVPRPAIFVEVGSDKHELFPCPPANRLLAAFVSTNDLSLIGSGSTNLIERYAILEVAKFIEGRAISQSAFSKIASRFGKQQEEANASAFEEVNRLAKKLASESGTRSDFQVVELKALGTFLNTEACLGALTLASMEWKSEHGKERIPMVCATCVVRTKETLLFAYVYRLYDGEKSVEWVKETARSWSDSIIKAN